MRYEISVNGNVATLALIDELTASDKNEFPSVIEKLFGKSANVVIDLSRLSYMDSAGLGFLLKLWQSGKEHSQEVSLKNPQGEVKELLELSDFGILFKIS